MSELLSQESNLITSYSDSDDDDDDVEVLEQQASDKEKEAEEQDCTTTHSDVEEVAEEDTEDDDANQEDKTRKYVEPTAPQDCSPHMGKQITSCGDYLSLDQMRQKRTGYDIIRWVLILLDENRGWVYNLNHGNKCLFFESANRQLFAAGGPLN